MSPKTRKTARRDGRTDGLGWTDERAGATHASTVAGNFTHGKHSHEICTRRGRNESALANLDPKITYPSPQLHIGNVAEKKVPEKEKDKKSIEECSV